VGYIKRKLLSDWSDINFIIGTNPDDFIELRFSTSSIDAPSGLRAYMSNLLDQDEQMLKYRLRRVPQYWSYRSTSKKRTMEVKDSNEDVPDVDETFVYYMLAPWWVTLKQPILYLLQF
jgi:hypothetical protein